MADVFDNISFIRTAHYGREVRTAIADSIEQCYADATGNPNSLASIIRALANGVTTGDVVEGSKGISEYISATQYEYTEINSIDLTPGVWLVCANVYSRHTIAVTDDAVYTDVVSFLDSDSIDGTSSSTETESMYNPNVIAFHPKKKQQYSTGGNAFIVSIDDDDNRLSEGVVSFWLFGWTNCDLGGSFKSTLTAIKIANDDSDDETSIVEQVATNTAAIATLQTLDTDISSLQTQHENDIDELTDLIEDSVVSLRASLDEKTFSLDENDYLTLD